METSARLRDVPVARGAGPDERDGLRRLAQRVTSFGVVSGMGWLLDLGTFSVLTHLHAAAGPANVVSASLAVTWVYATSARRIFHYGGADVRRRFLGYALIQVLVIGAASAAIAALVHLSGMAPLAAKLLVTPATFVINYRVMAWLTASAVLPDEQASTSGMAAPTVAGAALDPAAGSRPRILVFVPMYQCEPQIGRVLERLATHARSWCDHVLVVDNRSRDRSVAVAATALARLDLPGTVLLNNQNVNLGGSHKVAFAYALEQGYDWVVVVHGDDQAEPGDFTALMTAEVLASIDALLGARFGRGSRRTGYAWYRTLGNRVFNLIYSLAAGRRVQDLGSGLNAFRVDYLRTLPYLQLNDDLTFNIHLLLSLINHRARLRFVPISWRDEDQVSNVRLVRQALRTFGIACGYCWGRGRYLQRSHTQLRPEEYRGTVVATFPAPGSALSPAASAPATSVASPASRPSAATGEPMVAVSR